jgi:ABC-type transport system substrate-binding protein
MNPTIRRIAVSGSAAVALLGGAAAITTATAPSTPAAEMQTVIDRATGAPVNMPDGRVVHVRGMDAAAYKASPEQHSVIVQAAAKTDTTDPAGITTGLTADGGQGAAIQNPVTGQQTGYNQQVSTQSGGGVAIGAGAFAMVVLGLVVFFKIKHGSIKVGDAVLVAFLGVALSGTVFGVLAGNLTNSGATTVGNLVSGL